MSRDTLWHLRSDALLRLRACAHREARAAGPAPAASVARPRLLPTSVPAAIPTCARRPRALLLAAAAALEEEVPSAGRSRAFVEKLTGTGHCSRRSWRSRASAGVAAAALSRRGVDLDCAICRRVLREALPEAC